MTRLAAAQWSDFWKSGSITTFQGIFDRNYDREVAAFWSEVFDALPDGASIIDLACGNGALALLAAEYARDKDKALNIDALDFAEIQAPGDAGARQLLDRIRFFPGRRLEDTGLDAGSYALAVSQFGIEYGEREGTVAELDRILADRASLAFMCHREDSEVVSQARRSLENYRRCRDSKALEVARKLQTRLDEVLRAQRDPAKDRACERLRARLNDATGSLHEAAASAREPQDYHFFLQGCMAPFGASAMKSLPLAQRLALLDKLEQECDAFEARMNDLLSAALGPDQIDDWSRRLEAAGFRCERSEPVNVSDKLFAHALVFSR